MNRTTERFTAYTRWVTILVAVAFAFAARIDTLDIVKQLSEQHDVRARLVAMADPLLQQTPALLGQTPTNANAKDAALPGALAALKAVHPEIPTSFTPPESTDPKAWESALEAAVPPEAGARVLAEFRMELGKQEIAHLRGQLTKLKSDLDRSGLRIIPEHPYEKGYSKHLLGMLLSSFFLSLGGPFWFNALRQLSNLRPILAGKVDSKERQEARG